MSKKLVSDLLVDYLERRGVTELFGLCGHTVIGMLDALSRSKKLRYIGTLATGYNTIDVRAARDLEHRVKAQPAQARQRTVDAAQALELPI